MGKIADFISQVKMEMAKVAWPTKNELMTSTVVVIISTLFLGVFIGFCDIIVTKFINLLLGGAF